MPTYSGIFRDDTDTPVSGRIVRAYRRDTGALLAEAQSGSGEEPTDTHFGNVSLLLHCDGPNNSTSFTDSSATGRAVTAIGDAKISTTQSKFGGAAAYFDGSGDKLTIGASSDLALGAGDFTIEAWFYLTGGQSYARLIHFGPFWGDDSAFGINVKDADFPGKITFSVHRFSYISSRACVSTSNVALNTWNHVAVTRASGVLRLFYNGVLESTNSSHVGIPVDVGATNYLAIGSATTTSGGEDMAGYVDDVRITKGVARYTSSFTLPSAPHPNTDMSLALGEYIVQVDFSGEVQLVFLDDAGGTIYNDKILRVV